MIKKIEMGMWELLSEKPRIESEGQKKEINLAMWKQLKSTF